MPKIRLKNTSMVTIGDRRPGEVFTIECHDDGTPVDHFWRRRLADEIGPKAPGAIVEVKPLPAPVPAEDPAPVVQATPETSRGNGAAK